MAISFLLTLNRSDDRFLLLSCSMNIMFVVIVAPVIIASSPSRELVHEGEVVYWMGVYLMGMVLVDMRVVETIMVVLVLVSKFKYVGLMKSMMKRVFVPVRLEGDDLLARLKATREHSPWKCEVENLS